MKVLVLSATPRRGGNSEILAERIADGAREAGAEVEFVRLADLRIDPCDACDACQTSLAAPCVLGDSMMDLYPKVLTADALVLATPIYFFGAAAQMKCFLDRTYALGCPTDWGALAGKRVAIALTYGDTNPLLSGVANAWGMFRDACQFLRMPIVGCIQASCNDLGEVRTNQPAMDLALALGRRLGAPRAEG